jgi:hypothetical protein
VNALAILQRLDSSGRFFQDLEEALKETAEEVVQTGKPGTVTISLKVSNQGQGEPWITIDQQVHRSVPKKAPKGAFFFALEGELYKDDPRQTQMDFRTVESGGSEVREVETREKVERSIL